MDMTTTNHEDSAGADCTEGPDGCCTTCGVAMTTCNVCGGVGYHHAGCAESDEFVISQGRPRTELTDAFGAQTWDYVGDVKRDKGRS